MTAPAVIAKLDFQTIHFDDEANIWPFFVIGAVHAQDASIQEISFKLKQSGLEVLNISPADRANLHLRSHFQGVVVFVEKHLSDDEDRSAQTGRTGLNIYESYEKISRAHPIPVDPHALVEMQQLIEKIHRFQVSSPQFINLNPRFGGIEKTLQLLKDQQTPLAVPPLLRVDIEAPMTPHKHKASPELETHLNKLEANFSPCIPRARTSSTPNSIEAAETVSAIKKMEEQIETLAFMAEVLLDGDPQKIFSKRELAKAESRLSALKLEKQPQRAEGDIPKIEEEIKVYSTMVKELKDGHPKKRFAIYNLARSKHILACTK